VADDSLALRILACVEAIPPGHVMSYGDVAEYVGTRSARIVGRVLALDGGTVPWHRVLHSDGTCVERLYPEQRQRLIAEGVRFTGHRVDLARYRWDGRPTKAAIASRSAGRSPTAGSGPIKSASGRSRTAATSSPK
jgi:methylated-DNA-protein-cysteine methyltransferase related protein